MYSLYLIRNVGCDDETIGLARMTAEQLASFKYIIDNLNKNSTYQCMPKIAVYKINEDMLIKPNEGHMKEDIMYLDDQEYVLKDRWFMYDHNEETEEVERII